MWYNKIPRFRPVPVLPTVYSDALSYEEQIGKLGAKCNEIIDEVNKIAESIPVIADDFFATPEQYGAIGDGTTDDTTAIQNCLNSDKSIVVFSKDYKVGEILIPDNKTIIGINETLIKCSTPVVISEKKNVNIKGVKFTTTSLYQQTALTIYKSENIIIENCEFEGVYGGDIISTGIINVTYCDNCMFLNDIVYGANGEGLLIGNSTHCTVRGGKYYDNRRGSGVHVYVDDYGEVYGWNLIDGVECYNNAGSNIGISGYKCACVNCFVHDNNDTTFAIAMGHPNAGGSECIVANNILINNNNNIYTYEATNSIIANNVIDSKGKENPIEPYNCSGVSASANSYNIMVTNNIITGVENGVSGATYVNDNYINASERGIEYNANTSIKTYANNNTIEGCEVGCYKVSEIRNNRISASINAIQGEGIIVDNTLNADTRGIYETDTNNVSFIVNNVITSVERAIYTSKTGVFEHNMLLGSAEITAPNMTAENNYDFAS